MFEAFELALQFKKLRRCRRHLSCSLSKALQGDLRFVKSQQHSSIDKAPARHSPKRGVAPSFTKEQVVDAAFRLIDVHGYERFSMRALAAEMGMSPMSLYTYTKSKDQLLFGVLEKMRTGIDNRPVPGERWEDTLHRICGSIRENSIAHPHLRLMQIHEQVKWPQRHNRRIYLLHADQGMPEDAYELLYDTLQAYLQGAINAEVFRMVAQERKTDDPDEHGAWTRLYEEANGEANFHRGLDVVIAGVKAILGPENCNWRTPDDPADWTWAE